MAWSITNPFTALLQSDMPFGATSQASLFATIGAWINALAGNVPVTAQNTVSLTATAANTAYTVTVTFPSGRFTTPPLVQLTSQATSPTVFSGLSASAVTTTGFTLNYQCPAAVSGRTVAWLAVLSP